jgi:hypothetical protein
MSIRTGILAACAVVAFALALCFINRVPEVADGLLFGIAVGLLIVLSARKGHVRLS